LPDDAGHLIAVELDNRSLHLDLGHVYLRSTGLRASRFLGFKISLLPTVVATRVGSIYDA